MWNKGLQLLATKKFQLENTGELTKKVSKNIIYSFLFRVVSIGLNFLLVAVTLNVLGKEEYGIWLVISSIVSWINFFDLGLVNGLKNRIIENLALGNFEKVRKLISSSYIFIAKISILALIIILAIVEFVNWGKVLNAPTILSNEVKFAILYSAILFVIRFALGPLNAVCFAYQKGYLIDFINLIASFLITVIIYLAGLFVNLDLKSAVLIFCGIPVIVYIFISVVLYRGVFKSAAPSWKLYEPKLRKELQGLGLKFFIIQINTLVLFSASNILISNLFSPTDVTVYNIAFKYFSIISIVFSIVVAPFWPAVAEAYTKNDIAWIRNSIKRLNIVAALLCVCLIIMLLLAPWIYKIWLGGKVIVPLDLNICISFYIMMILFGAVYINILNGIGKVKLMTYCSVISCVVHIPLTLLFVKGFHMDVSGVVLATTICSFFGPTLGRIQCNKILNRTSSGIWYA